MPSHSNFERHSKFSFVVLGSEVEGVNWFKAHTSVARSHAAYWGGPHEDRSEQQDNPPDPACTDSEAEATKHVRYSCGVVAARLQTYRRRGKLKNDEAVLWEARLRPLVPRPYHSPGSSSIPCEMKPMDLFGAELSPRSFLGEGFVKQFVMSDHEDQTLLLDGCLMLSYAYRMALTGRGTKAALLQLKSRIFRCLTTRIEACDSLLRPRCLIPILALGAPVVCLVSQDLPGRMSFSDYISASTFNDGLCCAEFANIAGRALEERMRYWQVIRRLLCDIVKTPQDADGFALLRYISNCLNIQTATEADNHPCTLLDDFGSLSSTNEPCNDCSFDPQWTSPLTCQWLDPAHSRTQLESQLLLLTILTHRWFATFLDGDMCATLVPTDEVLKRRAELRHRIEQFKPVACGTSIETEAMYECCRWASLIMLSVEELRIPLHAATSHVPDKPRVISNLRRTDLSNLWGARRGLLFWVITVCHFSSAGKCLPLLCTTLFARFSQELAMLDGCFEMAVKPLRRLKQFEILCCRQH